MSGCVIALIICLAMVVVGGAILTVFGAILASEGESPGLILGGGERIGVITVSGMIQTDDGAPSLLGGGSSGAYSLIRQLHQAAEDDSIKAVLLRVNSPGGSAAASQAIATEVKRLAAKKPVVVSMGDVAASGAYYISAPATTIVASPATITGSIGVITQGVNVAGLAERFGVKSETLTSGPYKDTMSPYRAMRDDERKLMQAMVNEIFQQFVSDVASGRRLPRSQVLKLADGRVYTGSQAKRLKLVDELGNVRDALMIAARKAGIKGEPKTVDLTRGSGLASWFDGLSTMRSAGSLAPLSPLPVQGPGLWMVLQGAELGMAK